MFGRDYEEIGSSEKGLILKNSGKVKIQWGKKFIDLLDSKGNLNVKVQSLIKKVSSENEIKDDGFYYLGDSLIAKIGNNVLELTSESGTIFVSFMVEQETTDEQKYTALKNIGFIYKNQSEYNVYPKNGIIYIENSKSLFIVNNGTLSKYIAPIPNPFTEQFIIQRGMTNDNKSEGALIIKGEGLNNALIFDSLKIYPKGSYSIFESTKEIQFKVGNKEILLINLNGIETANIQSPGADNVKGYRIYKDDGKYILDIDRINVREGINTDDPSEYYDNNIYSKRFIISQYNIIYKKVGNINYLDYIIFNSNINDLDISNNSLVQIPIRVSKCELSSVSYEGEVVQYLEPKSYIQYKEIIDNQEKTKKEPKEEILNLIFKYSDYKLYLLSEDLSEVITPEIGKYPYTKYDNQEYNYIKLTFDNETYYYVPKEKDINAAFLNRSLYIISEPNTNQRLRFNFDDNSITLQQNDRRNTRLSEYDQIKHVEIGDIHNRKTYSDDKNINGLFSDLNVFVGGEFRHPIPTQEKVNNQVQDVPSDINYYHFPRYSDDLTKGMTELIFDHDEIILPKKWIPRAANYIEDLTSNSADLETKDISIYDGKLFLYKIGRFYNGNNIYARYKLSPQYNKNGVRINDLYTSKYYFFYPNGNNAKEADYEEGTIVLAQYKNGKIVILSRDCTLITIQGNETLVATEPNFNIIDFKNGSDIEFTVTFNSKTITIQPKISSTFEKRIKDIEDAITSINNTIANLATKTELTNAVDGLATSSSVSTLSNTVSNLSSALDALEARVDLLEET